jgi:hypothetical protein
LRTARDVLGSVTVAERRTKAAPADHLVAVPDGEDRLVVYCPNRDRVAA